MADQTLKVTSPVKIESDSKQRVAFDLALRISDHSDLTFEQKNEKYWLTLYRKCYKATNGNALEAILREE